MSSGKQAGKRAKKRSSFKSKAHGARYTFFRRTSSRGVFRQPTETNTTSQATIPHSDFQKQLRDSDQQLWLALCEVIQPKFLDEWLTQPNSAFDGQKPLELIEQGTTDRLWKMIDDLRSGISF